MKKILCYTLGIVSFSGIAALCNAERYVTKDQPVSKTFLEKYGRSFYDSKNVNKYPIPDVLLRLDGKGKTATAQEWTNETRKQIVEFFDDQIYGKIPPRPDKIEFALAESSDNALGGIAERRQYAITVSGKGGSLSFNVLLYLPKGSKNAPAFVCPNFMGNHAAATETEVLVTPYLKDDPKKGEKNRGGKAPRFPFKDIVSRGFAIATFNYNELYLDRKGEDAADGSVYKIFGKKFESRPSIVAWAWGNMRVFDLLETLPEIDPQHVAIAGHSRLSKTALVTAVHDPRFSYVCANNGGCMGEALSKRDYGENISSMVNINMPYWFSPNLKKYADNEGELPVDQHHLLSAIAPRPLYVASSAEDYWADPEGQLLGLIHACPAYALFGAKNFPTLDALEIEKPFHGDVAYHIRSGKHNITAYDWKNFMDYAQKRGWKPVPPKSR